MKAISFEDIRKAGIEPAQCMEWVADSIKRKSEALLPAKTSLHPNDKGTFCNFMPCIVPDSNGGLWGGVKVVTRYPRRKPALDSKLLLFDAQSGETLALMDADWITAMRTGAVAAHSIGLLAKKGFSEISIMGLGNTGRATLLMLEEVVSDRDLNITLLRHKGQEELFIERFAGFDNLHFSFADSYEGLVKGADVVVSAVTYLPDDICSDRCFKEGVLVVPVHTRGFTNCDLSFDKVFADDTAHVSNFKNFAKFHSFAEVSDVVNGRSKGRENDAERILAYNIGIAMHDVVFAAQVYQALDKSSLQDIELKQPIEKIWV